MINGISSTAPPQSVTPPAAVGPQQPPAKEAAPAQDSVQLSSAAISALTAKPAEASETPAQTEQEATKGDPVAIAKLAKDKIA
jgi:hypothetical protein